MADVLTLYCVLRWCYVRVMSDYPGIVEILSVLFEERYGGWQQPDMMDPCRVGLGGCPVQWTSGYELRKVTTLYDRTDDAGFDQDYAMTTLHLLNLTGGDPDATWTTSDYTTVEGFLDAFWTTLKPKYQAKVVLSGYRWNADGPTFKPHGSSLSPTLRNTARNVPGTSVNQMLPPQSAVTVTEVTDAKYTVLDVEGVGTQLRNRWGRFYLPSPDNLQCSAGRVVPAFCTLVSGAVKTLYDACVGAQFIPVMYSPTTGNAWSVKEIHVDDIFDVIRSRRYVTPTTRAAQTIATA
jgi:hypothetical protein